jgi:hypothetical protein
MPRKKKPAEEHPTIFVFEGSPRHYVDGSMLELHTQITTEEWEIIVEETIRYKVFLECLKNTGCPMLGEPWDEEDDWFRLQMSVAVSRMRNIDPLLVSKFDQKILKKAFTEKMEKNAPEVQELVEQVREAKKTEILKQLDDESDGVTEVSDL